MFVCIFVRLFVCFCFVAMVLQFFNAIKEIILWSLNKSFPSFVLSLCINESQCETILKKMCFLCMFIFSQIKLIFVWTVLYEDLF